MELWDVMAGHTELSHADLHPAPSHPERSEGAVTQHGPLRFAQGDSGQYLHSSRPRALQRALDRISTRYGARAVTTGAVRALTR